ncbi:Uncharacterized protein APZ42_010871 [Daphnia magna]|uniref:Uncharacterized protein n=2 Tax=Daphnia magna TaxID=35525 RepID=A0ABQ9YZG4_9CRUS|nr:hypothetical protein OUZ56_007305 [Daphnia magna]KZS22004.1 Uncharacterized protein APZ42_010871 [Daphnia magna]
MEKPRVNVVGNLKSTEELSKLISKSLAQVIRFSGNQDLKESCLSLLGVNNSYEAEKVIYQQLSEWKKKPSTENRSSISQMPAHKRKFDSQWTKMIHNDLEDWE